jgi:hypothetical protein
MILKKPLIALSSIAILQMVTTSAFAVDICAGKTPGSITFFNSEISRDSALPKPVDSFKASDSMFMLICLDQAVGPQASGGTTFRIDLYVDRKQTALTRPQLSKPRKEIITELNDSFKGAIADLPPGTHEIRFQAVTESQTGKKDVEINLDTGSVTKQDLRKAGYVADGKINVTK